MEVKIEPSWKEVLSPVFKRHFFLQLVTHVKTEIASGSIIYPPGNLIFNAFWQTPFNKVKVVILGQDPYHNPGQAHGLSFSVPAGTPLPPSLQNIYKEIADNMGGTPPASGDLTHWANQGVLLLNAALTVRQNEPASHAKIGWTEFTDAVITTLSEQREGLIFLLWGKFAQDKQQLIDETRHVVLKAAHPSPLSAYKGFLGCKHFSKVNEILTARGEVPIQWIPATT
ncbi:MAG: uracil-DNA glycosylase [Bacteroidota bacterium]|jgi:uracil-DNA glycosylase